MSIIKIFKKEDFGTDVYFQVINFGNRFPRPLKNRSVLQFSFGWMDFPSGPYLQIIMGSNGLFGLIFMLYRFSFDVDILSRTWNWDYMREAIEEYDT
jgi:hypothetical protein